MEQNSEDFSSSVVVMLFLDEVLIISFKQFQLLMSYLRKKLMLKLYARSLIFSEKNLILRQKKKDELTKFSPPSATISQKQKPFECTLAHSLNAVLDSFRRLSYSWGILVELT